jgi:deaminated glutathione amidase
MSNPSRSPSPRVAAVQMVTGTDPSANLLQAEQLIREAAEDGADLVVLPENFAFMGRRDRDVLRLRERDSEGRLQGFLSEVARRYGLWLVGGTIPLAAVDGERVRAACLVFDEHGERVARYDKIHLFDVAVPDSSEHYRESATIEPGEEIVVIDSPFGRLGLAVCYDLRFPEMFRRMLDRGLELLTVPAAFTATTGKAHWEVLVRSRAIENLTYLIAAAQGGRHANGRETFGHSMIVDPWGSVLVQARCGEAGIGCALDKGFQASLRRDFPVLEHRSLKSG